MASAAPILAGALALDGRGRPDALLVRCPWCERHHVHGPAGLTLADLGAITHSGSHCGDYKAAASPLAGADIGIKVATVHRGDDEPMVSHQTVARRRWRLHERLAAPDRVAIRAEGRKRTTTAPHFVAEWAGTSLRREVVRAVFGRAGGWHGELAFAGHVVTLAGWRGWTVESASKTGRRLLGGGRDLAGLFAVLAGLPVAGIVTSFVEGFDPHLSSPALAGVGAAIATWNVRGRPSRTTADPADGPTSSRAEVVLADLSRHPPGLGRADASNALPDPIVVMRRAGMACARRAVALAVPQGARLDHSPTATLAALYGVPAGVVIVRVLEAALGVRFDREAVLAIAEGLA